MQLKAQSLLVNYSATGLCKCQFKRSCTELRVLGEDAEPCVKIYSAEATLKLFFVQKSH